jgi:predicted ArsR family transcriptional regulator
MDLDNEAALQAGSERILGLIKRRGPQRIADVAATLAITAEAARQQIARLSHLGLLVATTERGGVGRPARAWALTDAGHARFPDRHAELAIELIDAVRAEFGERAVERMIDRRAAEMEATYGAALAGVRSVGKRLATLADMRSREGYMAEAQRTDGGWVLVENHCPICAAAATCQGFCRSELDVFRRVLGDDVHIERTEHVLTNARRCAYLVTATSPRSIQ